jgi:hypothetical protein
VTYLRFLRSEYPYFIGQFAWGCLSSNPSLPYRLSLFLFAGLAWALWNSRNKMAIEKRFPSNPLDVIRSSVLFMQKWLLLLKESDREITGKVLNKVKGFIGDFDLSESAASDIAVL